MHDQSITLPDLPHSFSGPSAWRGSVMAATPQTWRYTLGADDIKDLENAAQHFLALGADIGEISKNTFPLSRFANQIAQIENTILNGHGFQLLRGLPVDDYSQEFVAAIFCGIGAHLGSARSQNAKGHILGHVRDTGADASDPNNRIYQTNERQTFHTDSADLVGLLCLKNAREGGDSLLVSAESIYNRMRSERPDLLIKLFDPIATDRRGEIPEGAKPFMEIPVLNWHQEFLTVFYQRQYIDSASRFSDAMPLSSQHIEALDYFDSLANDPDLHLQMRLEPGDMQFVYNHSQLHDRTGFIDWPDKSKRRHLMRLWLSLEKDRPLPDSFKQRYGSIEPGNRGGIITANTVLRAPLDAEADQ